MSNGVQKILVIQDASVELCTQAVRYALQKLSLKSDDKIMILRVIQPFKATSTLSRTGCLSLGQNSCSCLEMYSDIYTRKYSMLLQFS